ncbi:acetate kinase [Aquimarina sp. AD10]|uniref:acetate/propionate family kinase n=1 Tax=Aquimarina sp. AD10 TaxID=1714849 RepID=UPI000E4AB721|nr:acetate kinase [Aquimarina sp. AD10]AXT59145.1 acetate kinase [Aquimarina sp. AD10]RKM93852.1 acetate/propionate family kinase [Aquimarina sp. AD10]
MQILVLNSGSSSIKFQLFKMPEAYVICSGLVERIGLDNAKISYKAKGSTIEKVDEIKNHKQGLQLISKYLMDSKVGVIQSSSEIQVVGHRVVHGGSTFSKTVEITNEVKDKIEKLSALAPLHNPANLQGILVAEDIFSDAKQVAVFDTAFHQTIPVEAYKYAIPNSLLEEDNIRLYGFHGTSHKYVSQKAIAHLKKENSTIITIHLGNGCSMTAVKNGKSIDHTLGFAPMNGLIMGTRSGDIDPAIIFYMVNTLGYTLDEVNTLLQKESGMLGLTGYSDLRDIQTEAEKGNPECILALKMNAYRIKKFIGAYATVMNGLDAIVFTAGIGENSDVMRRLVCEDLDFFGIKLDDKKNVIRSKEVRDISSSTSKVNILVIPTNEELEIARQSWELLS